MFLLRRPHDAVSPAVHLAESRRMTSAQNPPPQPIQRPGLIVSAINLVLHVIGLLIASLLFSILIEWAGLLLFWGCLLYTSPSPRDS